MAEDERRMVPYKNPILANMQQRVPQQQQQQQQKQPQGGLRGKNQGNVFERIANDSKMQKNVRGVADNVTKHFINMAPEKMRQGLHDIRRGVGDSIMAGLQQQRKERQMENLNDKPHAQEAGLQEKKKLPWYKRLWEGVKSFGSKLWKGGIGKGIKSIANNYIPGAGNVMDFVEGIL